MTNEQIADKLQCINGWLMEFERLLNSYSNIQGRPMPAPIYSALEQARNEVVVLAQQFKPSLDPDLPKRVDEALRYLRETPHTPANRPQELRRRMLAEIKEIEAEEDK